MSSRARTSLSLPPRPAVRSGRPAAPVFTAAEAGALLHAPERLVRRYLDAPARSFFPTAFQDGGGEWRIPERDLRAMMERRVEPHFSVKRAAELAEMSYHTVSRRVRTLQPGETLAEVPRHMVGARLFFGEEIRIPESELMRLMSGGVSKPPCDRM